MHAMPHRFDAALNTLISVIYPAIGAMFAAFIAAIAPEGSATGVLDNERLLAWAVMGALCGSVTSVIFFPPKQPKDRCNSQSTMIRIAAVKVLGSSFIGIFGTPAALYYLKLAPAVDLIAVLAFMIALLGAAVVKALVPVWERFFTNKFSPPKDDQ